jgi:hypothetical protein
MGVGGLGGGGERSCSKGGKKLQRQSSDLGYFWRLGSAPAVWTAEHRFAGAQAQRGTIVGWWRFGQIPL